MEVNRLNAAAADFLEKSPRGWRRGVDVVDNYMAEEHLTYLEDDKHTDARKSALIHLHHHVNAATQRLMDCLPARWEQNCLLIWPQLTLALSPWHSPSPGAVRQGVFSNFAHKFLSARQECDVRASVVEDVCSHQAFRGLSDSFISVTQKLLNMASGC